MAQAGGAGIFDDGAVSLATLAGGGGHHLAEHGPDYTLCKALAMAFGALRRLGTFLATRTGAFLTQAEGVDSHMRGVAEHGRLQIDGHTGQGISTRLGTRTRAGSGTTAEGTAGEDVQEVTHIPETGASEASCAAVRIVRVHAGIIHLSFLRVGQHLVRVVDFLEFVLKLRTCDIGMIFAAHLAIGLFDLIITGRSVNAQYFVVIRHSRSFSLLVPRAIVP